MNRISRISAVVGSCLAVGYFSKSISQSALSSWYPNIVLPKFSPALWMWDSIWNMLFILMGLAAALVWDQIEYKKEAVKKALQFFVIQLVLLLLWFYLFFGLKNPMLAFLEIILCGLLVNETYLQFSKINKISGYLLLPYLLWMTYMTVVCASIYWLNH